MFAINENNIKKMKLLHLLNKYFLKLHNKKILLNFQNIFQNLITINYHC